MVPRSILQQLARLRRRERWLATTWGAARWLAVVGLLLAACCLADWLIDRWQETPWSLRVAMLGLQAATALAAGMLFLVRPWRERLGDSELGSIRVVESVGGFQPATVRLSKADEPVRVLVELTVPRPIDGSAGQAVLTLTVSRPSGETVPMSVIRSIACAQRSRAAPPR